MLGARGAVRNVHLGDARSDDAPMHDLASFIARTLIVRMGVQVPMQRVVFHSVLYSYILESLPGDALANVAMPFVLHSIPQNLSQSEI